MDKNRFPTPPATDNPIVVLRSMSLQQELNFLDELMAAQEAGAVDRAAKCVIAALTTKMGRKLVNAMVSVVNNLAHSENHYPPSLKTLLCTAADLGFHEYAYNAANQVMIGAKSVKHYREAEAYFKLAMSFAENPALQAAAHVNYCPIVRDGLISGIPDWPAAVEIYETAARMGLVKAMFNAGNVSSWLADKGERAWGARAAYWFKYALDHRAARKPTLDQETPDELEGVFEQCMLALSACHIDAKFDGAVLEEGIRWAKELATRGNLDARNNLGVGYIRRLAGLTAQPQSSPGANWRLVLSQMDWPFKEGIASHTILFATEPQKRVPMKVDELTVELSDGSVIPLFVTQDPCLPLFGGFELLGGVAEALAPRYPDGFFLLTRKALFLDDDGSAYTPIYVFQRGHFSLQSLWMGSSPNLVLQHAEDGVDFLDKRFGTWTCMIPIAVNALDEGFVVASDAEFGQPWIGVGGPWRMPFLDESQLLGLGLALKE